MQRGQSRSEPITTSITFITHKGRDLFGAEAHIYPVSPLLHFIDNGNLQEFLSTIDNSLWAETLDNLPPETLMIIEYGNTFRVVIDISENLNKEGTKRAFDIARKWRQALRDFQGYRIDNEKDAFLASLERKRKQASYAKTAAAFNQHISNEMQKAYYWWNETQNARRLSQEWTIANHNFNSALRKVRKHLSFLFSDEKVEEIILEGWEQLTEGIPPFPVGYPLATDHLKETVLKEWRRRVGQKVHEPTKEQGRGENSDLRPLRKGLLRYYAKTRQSKVQS